MTLRRGLVVLLVLYVSGALCRPPRRSRRDVEIINPNNTHISNYNFTVAVLNINRLLGGGALITKQTVLTVAYNTDGFKPGDLRVRVGSASSSAGGKVYKVTRITQHPNYTEDWTSDLALLRLGAPVLPSVAGPIPVARTPWSWVTGDQRLATVTGFGETQERCQKTGSNQGDLQLANIMVYNHTECNNRWYGEEIVEGEICGNAPAVGPCWGDFGDPLVESDTYGRHTLVGSFAGSYGCADDKYPGIYVDVGYFYSWIQENV